MKLWIKILIALFLGVIVGSILGPEYSQYLKVVGQIFLRLINMVVVLLILSSMTVGISSIHDPQKLGRVGFKTLFLYIATTLCAIGIGFLMATIFAPGVGLSLPLAESAKVENAPTISEILLNIIPSNPIAAMASGDVLQVIVFALFLGVAINYAGEPAKPLLRLLEALADVMFRLTTIVMEFSPIGVFAIMGWVAGTFGLSALFPLAKFLAAYYVGGLLHIGIVFCGILWFMAGLNPIPFFKGMTDAVMVAFSTCSSSATLPVSMHCAHHNLGVSKSMCSFVLPLGSTVNMNGAAMFQGMAAIFVAQAYGIELSVQNLITIAVTSVMSAIGAAGIPGTGYIMTSVVLTSVGLPLEGLAILAGIDRIREMFSTVLNILGDAVCAVYVAKREGEFDERRYYHAELVEID